ncbi:unnamed protein product [Candidula unifasciata]|uniref:H15 domain-containing protein n=1 Tax=Candidula unifasciata TaxID=100452 RepID=A0A8S3ZUM3_9EUPU|nr:unnamed protein product [Candidula unifasciata]
MNRSLKNVKRDVVNAVIALKNRNGTTVRDIRDYLLSQGKISCHDDIKPAVMAALKSKDLSRPQPRSSFLFWGGGGNKKSPGAMSSVRKHRRRSGSRRRRRRSGGKGRKRFRRRRGRRSRRRRRGRARHRRMVVTTKRQRHRLADTFRGKLGRKLLKACGIRGEKKKLVVFCARRKK